MRINPAAERIQFLPDQFFKQVTANKSTIITNNDPPSVPAVLLHPVKPLLADSLAEELRPDVVLMDIAMPNLNGIEATAQITRRNPDIKVIILSMYADEGYILRALGAGAKR